MSVYTHISQQQLEYFLELYSIGRLKQFTGIQAGIENTNYAVTTTQGEFILTLFESLTITDLPCYLDLMNYLSQNDFPVPKPQISLTGHFLKALNNKPATFFDRLRGRSIEDPSVNHCHEIGKYLATLHLCSKNFAFNKPNLKNLAGCQALFNKISPNLPNNEIKLLNCELNYQSTYSLPDLPQGTIHGDLFRDNVLFEKKHISGILDLYNACTDYLIYDIAVTINDWCIENSVFNQKKFMAIISGYEKIRSLQNDEKQHFPIFLRLAALRFYLSRLHHQLYPKQGMLTLAKNPLDFRRLLENYRTNTELADAIRLSTQ